MAEHHAKTAPPYRALAVSFGLTATLLLLGGLIERAPGPLEILGRTVWPIGRIMLMIIAGLVVGQVVEAAGWTRSLSFLASPLFRFGRLGQRCSAAFTTAFFSGVAANAMLSEYYQEGLISKRQLFLTNFMNQLPAYFLHLPTTFFIVVPLTRWAGGQYFLLTLLAALLRSVLLLVVSHFKNPPPAEAEPPSAAGRAAAKKRRGSIAAAIRRRLPARVAGIIVWVVPIYIAVYLLSAAGLFDFLKRWMAGMAIAAVMPVESLSVVVLSFAAEFTSGFAAAGALMDAGVLTTKQTVLALLIGNIMAFPVRALRHQLPRYIGVFSPKLGTQLLAAGQAYRVVSLMVVAVGYGLLV